MPGARVNFEELRAFALHLNSVIDQLTDIESTTNSKLDSLDWDDDVFRRFEQQYRDGIRPFKNLKGTLEEFIKFLNDKANDLERYHS